MLLLNFASFEYFYNTFAMTLEKGSLDRVGNPAQIVFVINNCGTVNHNIACRIGTSYCRIIFNKFVNTLDFTGGTADISNLFSADSLGLDDLSDIQVLSIIGMGDTLLVLSQESQMMLAVDLAGSILSSYDLGDLVDSIEGVTVDENGNIYLVAENGSAPLLYVLSATAAVPAPGSFLLLTTALTAFAGWRRTKK